MRFILLSWLITLCCCGCHTESIKHSPWRSNLIVDGEDLTAPNFELLDLGGNKIGLKEYKGKFVFIHIATSWCPFCNAVAPYLERLNEAYKGKNVQVLIIDVREDRDLVYRKLAKRFDLTFPILLDEEGHVAASFAPRDVLPELARYEVMLASNLIIDPDGKVRYMSLLDSQHFDVELIDVRLTLDLLLQQFDGG